MGKLMFASLEDQLRFAEEVGLDMSRLKSQDVGLAFGAAQSQSVPASSPLLGDDTFELTRNEVLEAVHSLNK